MWDSLSAPELNHWGTKVESHPLQPWVPGVTRYFIQKRSYYSVLSCDAFCPLWLKLYFLCFQGLPFLGLVLSFYFCLHPLLSSGLRHKSCEGDGIVPTSDLEPCWFSYPPWKQCKPFPPTSPIPFIAPRGLITWKWLLWPT